MTRKVNISYAFLCALGITIIVGLAYIHQLKVAQLRLMENLIILDNQVEKYEKDFAYFISTLKSLKDLYEKKDKLSKQEYEAKREEIRVIIENIDLLSYREKFKQLRAESKVEREIFKDLQKQYEKIKNN